jgi:hypothetical protein
MSETLQESLRRLEKAAQEVLDQLLDEINEGESK